ncbi:DOC domain and unchracterized virulence related domain [Deinococcus geothermalis DSM 11300]|uniref:DOC domain and unchracterized virulence related domain n=2 Tax=Bacteria TaxID=2 RepID=Q1IWS7_DEIGD|nr:virulence protein RhuM/Fic/DOC family protein [Deinococcus geothermalis]ABF46307.1 DOC domain and unchracterized virulence related domain [Deinococcus geothermalis DSM 11300]
MKTTSGIIIYEGAEARVEVRLERETVWLSLQQLAELFGRDKSVISRHLKNIFATGELEREAVVAKNATTAADGKTYLVDYYNLDAIISVGYRVSSAKATRFRQWATTVLREHLTRGFTLNRQRFERNAAELEAALQLVRKAAAGEALTADQGRGLVDVIARYTQTFLWLQRYDEGLLTAPAGSPGGVLPTLDEARAAIARLKADLMARGEATDLFGRERGDAFAALLGNLDQTVFGEPAYPSIETKAAHLLYFVIKNHPFSDGNKRTGAFLFVDFLARNGRLLRNGEPIINDVGLAALALLVAESDAKNKDVMIRLIENMLALPGGREEG